MSEAAPRYVPHVWFGYDADTGRKGIRMWTGPGSFEVLSTPNPIKSVAQKQLRDIRRAMWRTYYPMRHLSLKRIEAYYDTLAK